MHFAPIAAAICSGAAMATYSHRKHATDRPFDKIYIEASIEQHQQFTSPKGELNNYNSFTASLKEANYTTPLIALLEDEPFPPRLACFASFAACFAAF
jgi:hypothetical protein